MLIPTYDLTLIDNSKYLVKMSDLVYSSAVLTMSQTTEFIRNKSVDVTIINLIIQKKLNEFTIEEAYNSIHDDLPIRIEQIENSFKRSLEAKTIEVSHNDQTNFLKKKFKIPQKILKKVDEQCDELKIFLDDSVNELFSGLINKENKETYKDLLLDVLTKMMAKYGYAYAGQLAGVGDASEFVPLKDLKSICEESINHYKVKITVAELSSSIGFLFDRRDPCLNNLAFSICNRYYISRLLGLDIPIDFIAKNLYEGATIFLDTNILMGIVFAKTKRHNEFRAILKNAGDLGINFSVAEITLAELNTRVQDYTVELEKGSEIVPDDLLTEVRGEIVEKEGSPTSNDHFNAEECAHKVRLEEMGVVYSPQLQNSELFNPEEYDAIELQIAEFDRKYRRMYPAKNKNALFHDAYLYFLIRKLRSQGEPTSAWFLTLDNSMIEHGIATKVEDIPPYSIRLFSLLQTLSQFVESQALKGEFADLFGELVSKDLLPRNQLFTIEDLKLLIGFDIRAKEIPPEFVRKAMLHVKKNILKGGQINDKNRSEAIHEFTKFLATPDQNFIEIRKKYDKKIQDRDEDIKQKDREIGGYKLLIKDKEDEINNLNDRVKQLEINQAQERCDRAVDQFNKEKQIYVQKDWENLEKEHKSLRRRYITFIIIALFVFSIVFFSDNLSAWLNLQVQFKTWFKYSFSILIFLAPFIRSFFEHKKVLEAFLMNNKSFRVKLQSLTNSKSNKEFESVYSRPKLEDFLNKK
jgi:hypothetical protein